MTMKIGLNFHLPRFWKPFPDHWLFRELNQTTICTLRRLCLQTSAYKKCLIILIFYEWFRFLLSPGEIATLIMSQKAKCTIAKSLCFNGLWPHCCFDANFPHNAVFIIKRGLFSNISKEFPLIVRCLQQIVCEYEY
jgi:hypothetical protein